MTEQSEDLVFRLRERARIRRSIPNRKSVQEGKPDRIADLLEEAADELSSLRLRIRNEDLWDNWRKNNPPPPNVTIGPGPMSRIERWVWFLFIVLMTCFILAIPCLTHK